VGRIDPEVEVLVDGAWRRGFADFRQPLDDCSWLYSMRLHWPLRHIRLMFVRYPERVRLPEQ
jgi:hypothetical protein